MISNDATVLNHRFYSMSARNFCKNIQKPLNIDKNLLVVRIIIFNIQHCNKFHVYISQSPYKMSNIFKLPYFAI